MSQKYTTNLNKQTQAGRGCDITLWVSKGARSGSRIAAIFEISAEAEKCEPIGKAREETGWS